MKKCIIFLLFLLLVGIETCRVGKTSSQSMSFIFGIYISEFSFMCGAYALGILLKNRLDKFIH